MIEFAKRLVEVDEVIKYLSVENIQKIPENIRIMIKNKKDKNYIWNFDESKKLNEQNLPRDTIAILSYLNMKYLLNDEQRAFMDRIHRINEQKLEEEKRSKYDPNNVFNAEIKGVPNTEQLYVEEESSDMVVYKEGIFSRIYKKVLAVFHIKDWICSADIRSEKYVKRQKDIVILVISIILTLHEINEGILFGIPPFIFWKFDLFLFLHLSWFTNLYKLN